MIKKISISLLFMLQLVFLQAQNYGTFKAVRFYNLTDSTTIVSSAVNGTIYYNDQSDKFRVYENGAWYDLLSSPVSVDYGTSTQVPFMNATNDGFSYNGDFTFNATNTFLRASDASTFSTVPLWSAVFGETHNISTTFNDGIIAGESITVANGVTGSNAIFGRNHDLSGAGTKRYNLIAGDDCDINVSVQSDGCIIVGQNSNITGATVLNSGIFGANSNLSGTTGSYILGSNIDLADNNTFATRNIQLGSNVTVQSGYVIRAFNSTSNAALDIESEGDLEIGSTTGTLGLNSVGQISIDAPTILTLATESINLQSTGGVITIENVVQGEDLQISTSGSATNGGEIYLIAGATTTGSAGSISITPGTSSAGGGVAGDLFLSPGVGSGGGTSGEIYIQNLRTSCAGAPSGSLANIAGVLNICP